MEILNNIKNLNKKQIVILFVAFLLFFISFFFYSGVADVIETYIKYYHLDLQGVLRTCLSWFHISIKQCILISFVILLYFNAILFIAEDNYINSTCINLLMQSITILSISIIAYIFTQPLMLISGSMI